MDHTDCGKRRPDAGRCSPSAQALDRHTWLVSMLPMVGAHTWHPSRHAALPRRARLCRVAPIGAPSRWGSPVQWAQHAERPAVHDVGVDGGPHVLVEDGSLRNWVGALPRREEELLPGDQSGHVGHPGTQRARPIDPTAAGFRTRPGVGTRPPGAELARTRGHARARVRRGRGFIAAADRDLAALEIYVLDPHRSAFKRIVQAAEGSTFKRPRGVSSSSITVT